MTQILELLRRHEGVRLKPYKDTVGKLSIGVGRNLDDVGITDEEADLMLRNDVVRCFQEAEQNFEWFRTLDETRAAVIVSMIFNLGINRFKGFKKMIGALEARDCATASQEMLSSKWAQQVGIRAQELSTLMRWGQEAAASSESGLQSS